MFLFLFTLSGIASRSQALSISATPVAGTCSADGQINANATGGTSPNEFRLSAGPAGTSYPTPWQVNSNFSGLRPGNYTVQVKDAVGAIASTGSITVSTTYTPLAISSVPTTPSICPTTGGSVTINTTGGKAPFSYSLLNGTIPVYGPQGGNVFTGINPGTYIAQVTDACGEIRTFSVTVLNNDYTWQITPGSDNLLITHASANIYAPAPFDTTKLARLNEGPLLFTCDSVAFRLLNRLGSTASTTVATINVPRRVYIEDLDNGGIVFDRTYIPSHYASNAPTVHLRINTNYRIYFDDLCNNVTSIDRNYSVNRSGSWVTDPMIRKTCAGYAMSMNKSISSNWNSLNRYNNAHDTLRIISSTLPGDTMVGKQLSLDMTQVITGENNFVFIGITPGHTYQIEVRNSCTTYVVSRTYSTIPPIDFTASISNHGCKLNTASINLSPSDFPIDTGYYHYTIHSGPGSFTDVNGVLHSITYPIKDSVRYSGSGSHLITNIRTFPQGSYNISMTDQCGNTTATKTLTIGPADVLLMDGYLTSNQQCPGGSSITFNRTIAQRSSVSVRIQKWTGSTWTGSGISNSLILYQANDIPPAITWTSLSDGIYRVQIATESSEPQYNAPIDVCDADLWSGTIHLQYAIPEVDSAAGYVCTAGSNSGKVTLFPDQLKGARPFQYQRVDGSGNPLSAYQTDSIFNGLSVGLHRFRILDNCGNATLYSYQLDTLHQPNINASAICPVPGTTLTITTDSIYQAIYSWSFTPAGGTSPVVISNDRVLTIPSFSTTDYGIYTISYTLSGCATAKSKSLAIASCIQILPVSLSSFTAKLNACNKVILNWKSETELNFQHFVVEHSSNGINFSAITTIVATGNNSSYSASHQPSEGKAYYRLRMIDIDGSERFSDILFVRINCSGNSIITLYPNPAKDKVTITGLYGKMQLRLVNRIGQVMTSVMAQNTTHDIDLSYYPPTIYMVQVVDVKTNKIVDVIKLIKQ